MKKLIGLSLGAVIAFTMMPANANTVENFLKRTAVRVNGHYDVPTNERLAFAQRATAGTAIGETFFVEPDNDFDFGAGIEHAIPMSHSGSHMSVVLDYDHFASADNNNNVGAGSIVGGIAASINTTIKGSASYETDTWRLGLRRGKEFGKFDWRFGAFIEHTNLERVYEILESNNVANTSVQSYRKDEAEGWGPSFDMTGRLYPFGRNNVLSVFATGELAFLYADQKYRALQTQNAVLNGNINNTNHADLNQVITRVGGSVGVTYARPISENVAIAATVGGRWVNYHNAFKHSSNLTDGRTDFGRAGPFIELRIGGTHSPAI